MSLFTADHHGYYQDGCPFFPLIQENVFPFADWSNAVLLRLPAHLNDDLCWAKEKEIASQIIAAGKSILWDIDLGLPSFTFTPENSAAFFSFSLAIEEFSNTLWPQFQKHTFGAALYRGPISSRNFPQESWESSFTECKDKWHGDYELYCTQMLSEYLHRLVSFLPDAVLPFGFFETTVSPGKGAQLFSKERFEHLHLSLKGISCSFAGICWEGGSYGQGYVGKKAPAQRPVSSSALGIYLPSDVFLDAPLLQELDKCILKLTQKQIPFRVIPEEKLTEQWDGLDQLLVPAQAISAQGRRKLLGFLAAGGNISSFHGDFLDLG